MIVLKDKAHEMDITMVSMILNEKPAMPVFSLFYASALYHMIYGLNQAYNMIQNKKGIIKESPFIWNIIGITSIISGFIAGMGVAGYFYDIQIPPFKRDLFRKIFDVAGV